MRIYTDDDLRRVDSRFLGLPGWTFFWNPTRYVAYGFGAIVFPVLAWLFTCIAGWGAWTAIYALAATVLITGRVMRAVDDERPLSAWGPLVWEEIGTPRTSRHERPQSVTLRLPAVVVFNCPADHPRRLTALYLPGRRGAKR